jgi:flagellin
MSVDIDTNMAAIMAANNLAASNAQLQTSITKLSSGSRIVTPADDAGGLAVSMKLSAAANRDSAVQSNIADTNSYLQTQDGAMQVAGQILDRISELKTLYADPTKNSSDLANYDSEFTALQSQLGSIASGNFNGVSLFGSSTLSVSTTEDGSTSAAVTVGGLDLTSTSSGIGAILSSVTSSATSLGAIQLTDVTSAIQNLATFRADNGAEQSQLTFASSLAQSDQTNLTAASSQITDVDVAQESTNLAKWNVLVQSGASMLYQANQSSQIALKLLQ